jgi:hypothetical protein
VLCSIGQRRPVLGLCTYLKFIPYKVSIALDEKTNDDILQQIYSAIDDEAESLVDSFGDEASWLWEEDGALMSITSLLAAQYMSLGYQFRGKDHAVLQYLAEVVRIGTMGLFGVERETAQQRLGHLSAEQIKIASYAAWGIFNWTM